MAHVHGAHPEQAFTDAHGPGRTSAETAWRWRRAGTRRDLEMVRTLLAPDVVLRLPATDEGFWTGPTQVIDLLTVVFGALDFIDFQEDIGDEDIRVLRLLGRVNGVNFEEAHFLRFDDHHRVRDATFFIRPALGLAAVTEAVGPQMLTAHHSRGLGLVAHHFLRTARRVMGRVDRHIIPRGIPDRISGQSKTHRGSES